MNEELKAAYIAYTSGLGISDAHLDLLLNAAKAALPLLAVTPIFALTYRETFLMVNSLVGFKRERERG